MSKLIDGVSNCKKDARGTKLGTFTVLFANGVVVHNVMLHGSDNKRWVMWPSIEYVRNDGERGFLPLFSFVGDIKEQIESEIFDALRALKANTNKEGRQ